MLLGAAVIRPRSRRSTPAAAGPTGRAGHRYPALCTSLACLHDSNRAAVLTAVAQAAPPASHDRKLLHGYAGIPHPVDLLRPLMGVAIAE